MRRVDKDLRPAWAARVLALAIALFATLCGVTT